MKFRTMAFGAVAAGVALLAGGAAEARNPNCAGGIQYLVQAMRDKDKGNTEDYQRELGKAVDRLTMCAAEDTVDFEAHAYLGWALAESDSSAKAGVWFQRAIAGLTRKGDRKKADWANQNRESYWANAFNDGIAKINAASAAYADFDKEPADDAEKTLKEEARKKYEAALVSLTRAANLRPGHAQTLRNLGSVHAFMGDFQKAEAVFRDGLQSNPGDTLLTQSIKLVRTNYANQLIEQKKFDEAIQFFSDLAKDDAANPDLHLGIADAYFKRAFAKEGDARKPDFKQAGASYSKAAELKSNDADLLFNAGLAYQNAGEWAEAEKHWRGFLKARPDDTDGLSSLASTLVELKKCDDAVQTMHQAVVLKPQEKVLHRQLGGIYAKCNNNDKSYQEMVVYLALEKGKAAEKPSAPAGTDAATAIAQGAPQEIRIWEADGEKYETWFFWDKKYAQTFKAGRQMVKSDWSAVAATKPGAASAGKK